MFARSTETAMAALGYLAEVYDDGATLVSAEAIAEARGLQRPWVSKILTVLAQADLVAGVRGPGGGFTLTRPPAQIRLAEAVALFERPAGDACPFGGGICGVGDPCPLHDQFAGLRDRATEILEQTTFAVFCRPA